MSPATFSDVDLVHRRLANALFDALERNDAGAIREIYDPGLQFWFNVSGATIGVEENLRAIVEGAKVQRRRTYDDREIRTFDDGFLARYSVKVTVHNGRSRTLWACLIGEVNRGKITKLWEYIDSGKFGAPRRTEDDQR